MKSPRRTTPATVFSTLAAALAVTAAASGPADAMTWTFDYLGGGFSASGSFVTGDTPDGSGYYALLDISGQRNGVAITGLDPAGVPIPGNEPFPIDNLVSIGSPQLTVNGIGFSLADGNHVNLYYASFLSGPAYNEIFSAPPFQRGFIGPEDHEGAASFTATPVPEPTTAPTTALALLALAALARQRRRR